MLGPPFCTLYAGGSRSTPTIPDFSGIISRHLWGRAASVTSPRLPLSGNHALSAGSSSLELRDTTLGNRNGPANVNASLRLIQP